ncbi:type VI secretion system baseplate subunit TssF [Pseudomonas sp. 148P]|uniref:Type VI secretion system baseplate subunit TssF n=1 Tax=Pseudomonas ulcerans TaxID=3115852 RepID=A0ABU7HUK9_9PSED|nr:MULTISPECIES: type VI secretion system baseplate subunit TssF [unclassified Pseudomonas]MEE1924013.1 type VI secretion system baseplate subunit TssF [Pseudomonas sp. 147P]MEE1935224.1 type VI secretion system baseplate subunit TssF [Pseudomonas sp. 148P]
MSLNHYYQSELTALRQLGKRFAERNPALAPFLGETGRDPDVERLLEGFAFLTGRLRQKLDDDLPELTHSLMHLLWPNYMRPLPAFGMLQFEPTTDAGSSRQVPRHTPVQAEALEGVHCRFQTAYDTEVLPLALQGLDYAVTGDGAVLSLKLMLSATGQLADLDLTRLRLHLSGERYISQQLYLSLLQHLDHVQLQLLDASGIALEDSCDSQLGPQNLKPVGFAENEALVPYPLNTFRGYRHLQEYFAFPEKYLFVDLEGLDVIRQHPQNILEQARGLSLRFNFRGPGAQRIQPTLDNIRLYCTPIVNLFSDDAVPLRMDGKQDRYPLLAGTHNPLHHGVFSVDKVTGWEPGGIGHTEYVLFESFEHDDTHDYREARPHYSVRQEPSVTSDRLDTYLCFGQRHARNLETISVELTCTNQNLPRQLNAGQVCLPCVGTPASLQFRNIGRITPSYAPPLHRDFLWKLISNMSLNYLSLANVEALKVILETYDLPRYYDKNAEKVSRKLLAGLTHIRHEPTDRLYRGLPVRGVRTRLSVDTSDACGEGELYLFASVLNEFFALYASLNSFHELHVYSAQGENYQWTPRMGQQPLL